MREPLIKQIYERVTGREDFDALAPRTHVVPTTGRRHIGHRVCTRSATVGAELTMQQPEDLVSALEGLVTLVRSLYPDWRNAERFYERRSELINKLQGLATSSLARRIVVRFIPTEPSPPVATTPPAKALVRKPLARRFCYPHPPRKLEGQPELPL